MMKIDNNSISDKVWQLYVLCGVCIYDSKVLYLKFEKWGCGVLLWFLTYMVYLLSWVLSKTLVKVDGICLATLWKTAFISLVQNTMTYVYVHHLKNLFYFHMLLGLLGLVEFLGFGNLICFAKHCLLKLMRERLEWYDPLDS